MNDPAPPPQAAAAGHTRQNAHVQHVGNDQAVARGSPQRPQASCLSVKHRAAPTQASFHKVAGARLSGVGLGRGREGFGGVTGQMCTHSTATAVGGCGRGANMPSRTPRTPRPPHLCPLPHTHISGRPGRAGHERLLGHGVAERIGKPRSRPLGGAHRGPRPSHCAAETAGLGGRWRPTGWRGGGEPHLRGKASVASGPRLAAGSVPPSAARPRHLPHHLPTHPAVVSHTLCVYRTLFRTSSSFFSTSPGVRSNSAAIDRCLSAGSAAYCSHRSPSTTWRTGK